MAFAQRGLVPRREALAIAPVAFIFSILGALCVTHVPRRVLIAAMPVALIGVAISFAVGHRPREDERQQRLSLTVFVAIIVAPLAF